MTLAEKGAGLQTNAAFSIGNESDVVLSSGTFHPVTESVLDLLFDYAHLYAGEHIGRTSMALQVEAIKLSRIPMLSRLVDKLLGIRPQAPMVWEKRLMQPTGDHWQLALTQALHPNHLPSRLTMACSTNIMGTLVTIIPKQVGVWVDVHDKGDRIDPRERLLTKAYHGLAYVPDAVAITSEPLVAVVRLIEGLRPHP